MGSARIQIFSCVFRGDPAADLHSSGKCRKGAKSLFPVRFIGIRIRLPAVQQYDVAAVKSFTAVERRVPGRIVSGDKIFLHSPVSPDRAADDLFDASPVNVNARAKFHKSSFQIPFPSSGKDIVHCVESGLLSCQEFCGFNSAFTENGTAVCPV